eukprot:TRINITY_DN3252_c0_g1_i2.p1 TRINITY_DN3252_c0_g1~~TRINITY_DN3252_c0_g1_i2.p1  ORF type:complete len:176 (-),score=32.21 TRINITY_DN3252_c0_g1_i2:20-547(-)
MGTELPQVNKIYLYEFEKLWEQYLTHFEPLSSELSKDFSLLTQEFIETTKLQVNFIDTKESQEYERLIKEVEVYQKLIHVLSSEITKNSTEYTSVVSDFVQENLMRERSRYDIPEDYHNEGIRSDQQLSEPPPSKIITNNLRRTYQEYTNTMQELAKNLPASIEKAQTLDKIWQK